MSNQATASATPTADKPEPSAAPPPLIPGLEGVPIAESSVSFVDGQVGKLEYRGINVERLAEHSTLYLRGDFLSAADGRAADEGTAR